MPRYPFLSILLALFLSIVPGYSKISVDFSGVAPVEIITIMTNFGIGQFESVVISHPFKTYDSVYNTDGIIYDWNDTGNKTQQSGLNTIYGNLDGFKKFVEFLKENKITVMCKADIFSQYGDFNLDIWNTGDFTPESVNYLDYNFIDLKNDKAKDKVRQMLSQMKNLPVDKWIIDLSKVPLNEQAGYFAFVRDNAGWAKCYFASQPEIYKDYKDKATSYYYTLLLDTLLSSTNLADTSIYSGLKSDVINIIPDKDIWIYHFAVGLYFAASFPGTIIPASFLKQKSAKNILSQVSPDTPYTCVYHGMDTIVMTAQNGDKIVAINLSGELTSIKLDKPLAKKGVIKSVMGNYPLTTDNTGSYLLVPPGSVYVWVIQ